MKEIRVYVVNGDLYDGEDSIRDMDNHTFIEVAEEQGTVFSLKGFETNWNNWDCFAPSPESTFLRFIEVECAEIINFEEWNIPSVKLNE